MIDANNNGRIIGDFLEINADIVQKRFNSKLPKLLADIDEKYYRHKLIKKAKSIKDSHMCLSIDNLAELFIYTFNNFPPNGKYKTIIRSKVMNDSKYIEGIVKFEDIIAIISIDREDNTLDVNIKQNNKQYCTRCDTFLKHKVSGTKVDQILCKINEELLNILTDYIIETLQAYNHRKDK